MLSRNLIASGIILTSFLSQGSISEKTYDSTFSQKIAQNSKVSIINWEPYDLNFDENQIIATYWSYEQHKLILKNYPIKGWEISIQRDDKNKTEIFDFEMDYNTKIQILEIYQQNQKKDRLNEFIKRTEYKYGEQLLKLFGTKKFDNKKITYDNKKGEIISVSFEFYDENLEIN